MNSPLSDDRLAEVLAAYPIAGPRVEGSFEASTRNDNLLVRDDRGQRFVLRRHRRNRDPVRVDFQLRFEHDLFDAGFPAARVLTSRSGALVAMQGDDPFALFEYVEGKHLDFERLEQTIEAGRRLAEFHLVTERFTAAEVAHELSHPVNDYWTQAELEVQRLYEMFGEPLADELAFMRSWLEELHRALPLERLHSLPSGWLHSDYHGRNLIFGDPTGNVLLALLDFDKIERGPYVLDVGRALIAFGREARGSPNIRLDVAGEFLESYEGLRPLDGAERSALLALIGVDAAPYSAYYPMLARDGVDPLAAVKADFATVRRARTNAAVLASVLLGS